MGVEKPLKRFKKDKSDYQKIDISLFISDLQIPLKSPPCKRCPALDKGICKCAKKRLK